jgi:aerobic-type carbon monoxide dehydrogenase small subunit (CoxS/CutS family)
MIMNATGLLYENPEPSKQEIIDVMKKICAGAVLTAESSRLFNLPPKR